jgi:hypothetical protein
MLFDLIGMLLIVSAIKLNCSDECFYPNASTDSCLHVSATSIKDTDTRVSNANIKLKHSITIKTNDLCVETKIFTRI